MHNPVSSRNRYNCGMTLIELLVVVAIIAILAACIIPVVKGSVEMSKKTKCLGNLRQIWIASELYTQENNNQFPDIDAWPSELSPYTRMTKYIQDLPTHSKTVFWCPAAIPAQVDTNYNGNVAYAINVVGYAGQGRLSLRSNNGAPVVNSKLIAFIDAHGKNMWETTPERVALWHGSSYNAVFVDGHAESLSTNQFPPGSKEWKNLLYGYSRF